MRENRVKKMISEKIKWILITQCLLFFYSLGSICSKLAAQEKGVSTYFILYYGILLFILFVYAVGWQQVVKRLPLTTAYANKAITVVWGILWGTLVFHETLTTGKILGATMVILGVVLNAEEEHGLS